MRGLVVALAAVGCAHHAASSSCTGPRWTELTNHPSEAPVEAATPVGGVITDVSIAGVDPALAATLRGVLETRPGQWLTDAPLGGDLRRLWAFGVLADARVDVMDSGPPAASCLSKRDDLTPACSLVENGHAPNTIDVVFAVRPQPVIDRVEVGRAPELRRMRWLEGTLFEPRRIARMADAIELAYVRDGHVDAKVAVRRARSREVALCVAADPGPRVVIRLLRFPGRRAIPERVLLDQLRGEKGHVNHVGGTYEPQALADDYLLLDVTYYDRGMLEVKIDPARVERHGDRLDIAIPIHEGPVFRVGTVRISPTLAPIAVALPLAPGDIASRSKIVDASARVEAAVGHGAYVQPLTHIDEVSHRVDLTFEIQWRWPWDMLRSLSSR